MSCLLLVFLAACQGGSSEDAQIAAKDGKEETTLEEEVHLSDSWQGDWFTFSPPAIIGQLTIYEETDEGFSFIIELSNDELTPKSKDSSELIVSFKSLGGYAKKDGPVAVSEKKDNGCVLTLQKGAEGIEVKESEECADPELTVDFNHSFTPAETFVIDEHFLASIKEGKFTPDGYGIGTPIRTIIDELGKPDAEIQRNEAFYHIYSHTGYGTAVGENTVGLLTVIQPEPLTPEDIKKLMGEPEQEGPNEMEGLYFYYYTIDEKYELYFEFLPEEKTLLRFHLRELKLM
ncbi:YjgB family protein [Sutcliffiella horikoshii]|uniref:DUF4309 domain-containing protein n=1 Tax=Sutcliffiella horikoshii TaxID=79883 RepID=UPI001CBF1CBC|nr:DUF4309 domain-containing protein [Sutcliffiella horikoshii]UAL47181.1 YjgB family protein [Sutcliffiella horikoshii]